MEQFSKQLTTSIEKRPVDATEKSKDPPSIPVEVEEVSLSLLFHEFFRVSTLYFYSLQHETVEFVKPTAEVPTSSSEKLTIDSKKGSSTSSRALTPVTGIRPLGE